MNREGLSESTINAVICVVVFSVIAVPIFYGLTTEPVVITNDDIIGPLRLGYQESVYKEEVIPAEEENEEDEVIIIDITDYITRSYVFTVDGDTISVTGDWNGELSLSEGQIIIGSDDYALTIQYGKLLESKNGYSVVIQASLEVSISDGRINGIPYTHLYYPDTKGQYANYHSYVNDIAEQYSAGTYAGVTVSAISEEVIGSNPYNFTANERTEEDMTVGMTYTPNTDTQSNVA